VSNHHWHGFICVLVCRCRFAARSSCKLAAAALVATLSVAATYRRTASHLAHSTPYRDSNLWFDAGIQIEQPFSVLPLGNFSRIIEENVLEQLQVPPRSP